MGQEGIRLPGGAPRSWHPSGRPKSCWSEPPPRSARAGDRAFPGAIRTTRPQGRRARRTSPYRSAHVISSEAHTLPVLHPGDRADRRAHPIPRGRQSRCRVRRGGRPGTGGDDGRDAHQHRRQRQDALDLGRTLFRVDRLGAGGQRDDPRRSRASRAWLSASCFRTRASWRSTRPGLVEAARDVVDVVLFEAPLLSTQDGDRAHACRRSRRGRLRGVAHDRQRRSAVTTAFGPAPATCPRLVMTNMRAEHPSLSGSALTRGCPFSTHSQVPVARTLILVCEELGSQARRSCSPVVRP